MKLKPLLELLSKKNWEAQVRINLGLPSHSGDDINSITESRQNGKPIVTINSFRPTKSKE